MQRCKECCSASGSVRKSMIQKSVQTLVTIHVNPWIRSAVARAATLSARFPFCRRRRRRRRRTGYSTKNMIMSVLGLVQARGLISSRAFLVICRKHCCWVIEIGLNLGSKSVSVPFQLIFLALQPRVQY
jgi:hypothetical protein